MNRKLVISGASVATLLAAFVITVVPVHAQGKGIVAAASGSGQITIGDDLRTFAFTAQRDSSNNTRGQAQLYNRNQDLRTHIAINCLSVSGNVATMSGTVTGSTTQGLPTSRPEQTGVPATSARFVSWLSRTPGVTLQRSPSGQVTWPKTAVVRLSTS